MRKIVKSIKSYFFVKTLHLLLEKIVKKSSASAVLLSGGLNSSILAYLAAKNRKMDAITVAAAEKAPDCIYAKKVADTLHLVHYIQIITAKDVLKEVPKLIKIIKSFDPTEIKNMIIPFIGLTIAQKKGLKIVLAGDGANETFLGYPFLYHKSNKERKEYLAYATSVAQYHIHSLAADLNINAVTPFLDYSVLDFAKNADISKFIQKREDTIYGKYILRKTFEKDLPSDIIWRVNSTVEESSGCAVLTHYIDEILPIEEFESQKDEIFAADNVEIKNNEQFYYYKIYKRYFGVPFSKEIHKKHCPYCKNNIPISSLKYCPTCGSFLI